VSRKCVAHKHGAEAAAAGVEVYWHAARCFIQRHGVGMSRRRSSRSRRASST
jgi:hypothetical protein